MRDPSKLGWLFMLDSHSDFPLPRTMPLATHKSKYESSCRDEAILNLPLGLKMSSLVPVEEDWPMKMLPPFATPPKAPKWRM